MKTFSLTKPVTAAGPPGSAASVDVTVDFGATFACVARVTVVGQAWVTALSKIVATCKSATPEEAALHGFSAVVSALVAGVGFTLTVIAAAWAKGTYTFACVGV